MRLCAPSAVLGVVLLATAGQAADSGAPLESTRQELRNLGGAQKASSGPGATEGLRPNLPAIQSPGQEALPPLQLVDPEKLEKERKRKKEERKNWLVNGVEQLERQDKQKESNAVLAEESQAAGNDASDSHGTDPQYLLKLYDEQKKREDAHKLETKPQRSPTDPLAPFLQGWLGNSPVRGQFFDEFARNPGDAGDPGAPISVGARDNPNLSQSSGLVRNPGSDVGVKPNPYLAELNPPVRSEPPNRDLSVQNALNPEIAAPSSNKPLIPLVAPPVEVRSPERKALPSPLADDKKYFPQLKKF
jgi:hypothetical protein